MSSSEKNKDSEQLKDNTVSSDSEQLHDSEKLNEDVLNDNSVLNDSEQLGDKNVPNDSAVGDKPKVLGPRKVKLNRRSVHMANGEAEAAVPGEQTSDAATTVVTEVKSQNKVIKLTYANGGVGKFWNGGSKRPIAKSAASTSAASVGSSSAPPASSPSTSAGTVATASTSSTDASTMVTASRARCVYVSDRNVRVNVSSTPVTVPQPPAEEAAEPPKKKHKPITWP